MTITTSKQLPYLRAIKNVTKTFKYDEVVILIYFYFGIKVHYVEAIEDKSAPRKFLRHHRVGVVNRISLRQQAYFPVLKKVLFQYFSSQHLEATKHLQIFG